MKKKRDQITLAVIFLQLCMTLTRQEW